MALTPMMQQYFTIKEQYKDCILFYRLGDFYEMFFEDAETASKELELVLTGRDCGLEERAPMCGIPYHAAAGYIGKLIQKGYKVATMLKPASTFWRAEDYHQQYYQHKGTKPYCHKYTKIF